MEYHFFFHSFPQGYTIIASGVQYNHAVRCHHMFGVGYTAGHRRTLREPEHISNGNAIDLILTFSSSFPHLHQTSPLLFSQFMPSSKQIRLVGIIR